MAGTLRDVSDEAAQQHLIDRAHESRKRDNQKSGLSTLTFFMEPITSLGLKLLAVQRPDLKGLYLMRSEVSDEGFEAINDFCELEELNISETRLTVAAVKQIDPSLPLQNLTMAKLQVSPESFSHIAQIKSLRRLDCQEWPRPGDMIGDPIDEALQCIPSMSRLEELNVGGHLVLGPGFDAVREMCGLRFLGLSMTSAPASHLALLGSLTRLETLLLRGTGLNDEAMQALSVLRDLRHLDVSSTEISDQSVSLILGFSQLERLGFEHVRVSREAAERLFELPHLKSLEISIEGVESEYWYGFIQDRPSFHLEA
jgi:hypothetical protein